MYTEFFGLNEKPFSISPDPRYLYLSQRHADALAHLIYGISESGGFIQLTGEVGTGKTTLIRSLLEQLPAKTEIALVLNPQLSTKEFLQSICQELRAPPAADDSVKAYIDSLNAMLLEAHAEDRRVVLIVDEAQTLSPELLEQVRLLTNLETAKRKLLQIILIGQPELRDLLGRPEMRQIAQRITGRYHLEPLSAEDATIYIRHRMKVAGAQAQVFSKAAMRRIYRLSGGIPRLINVIADRALLAAYAQEQPGIDAALVQQAANEVFGRPLRRRWWPWAAVAAAIIVSVALTTNVHEALNEEALQLAIADAGRELGLVGDDVTPAAATDSPANAAAEPVRPAPVEAAPGDAPAAEPSLGALLTGGQVPTDVESATAALFGIWGLPYAPDRGATCAQAEAAGLRCLALSGSSVAELRRLNRPALLSLTDADAVDHHVVLRRLERDHAELRFGDESVRVSIADLTRYLYGDHLLLWKPMTDVSTELKPGMRGERVIWLRESLAKIRGETATADDPALFDEGLAALVRDYQRQRRLDVDGLVGSRTQIVVQTDLKPTDEPLLAEAD